MNKTDSLQFRSFVPSLVTCLEDSDGGVRETAKSCVVELFRYEDWVYNNQYTDVVSDLHLNMLKPT
jgi:hypothetical protein